MFIYICGLAWSSFSWFPELTVIYSISINNSHLLTCKSYDLTMLFCTIHGMVRKKQRFCALESLCFENLVTHPSKKFWSPDLLYTIVRNYVCPSVCPSAPSCKSMWNITLQKPTSQGFPTIRRGEFTAYMYIDIGHPCNVQLTAVKSR